MGEDSLEKKYSIKYMGENYDQRRLIDWQINITPERNDQAGFIIYPIKAGIIAKELIPEVDDCSGTLSSFCCDLLDFKFNKNEDSVKSANDNIQSFIKWVFDRKNLSFEDKCKTIKHIKQSYEKFGLEFDPSLPLKDGNTLLHLYPKVFLEVYHYEYSQDVVKNNLELKNQEGKTLSDKILEQEFSVFVKEDSWLLQHAITLISPTASDETKQRIFELVYDRIEIAISEVRSRYPQRRELHMEKSKIDGFDCSGAIFLGKEQLDKLEEVIKNLNEGCRDYFDDLPSAIKTKWKEDFASFRKAKQAPSPEVSEDGKVKSGVEAAKQLA